MNTCESYAALLDAFAEGDLFTEDMIRVQQHLLNCPDCQAYLEDLLAIQAAFPKLEDTVVPPDFSAKVMATVAATPQERPAVVPQEKLTAKKSAAPKRKTPWSRVLVPLAACCAIVILLQGRLSFGSAKSEEAPAAGEYAFMMDSAAPMEAAKAEEAAVEMEAPATVMPETESCAEPVGIPAKSKQSSPTSNDSYEYAATESDIIEYSPYRIRIDVDAAYIGDALDDYTPVIEADSPGTNQTELHYELTMAQYEDLLHALADRNELPAEEEFETDSDLVLVIVH